VVLLLLLLLPSAVTIVFSDAVIDAMIAAGQPRGMTGRLQSIQWTSMYAATIVTSKRSIGADAFFKGMYETALAPDELITAVRFPVPQKAAYAKFPNPASRFALVGVFVAKTANGVRVAVTGAGPSVFRSKPLEDALARDFSAAAARAVKLPSDGLNNDLHGSPAYRAHLIAVMAARAVSGVG